MRWALTAGFDYGFNELVSVTMEGGGSQSIAANEGLFVSAGLTFLPLLDGFCAVAPTQVGISEEVLGGAWDALLSGRADIAVGASQEGPAPHRLSVGYRSEPLGTIALAFAIAPSHPLAALPSPLAVADIRRHRQIVVRDTSQQLPPRTTGLVGAVDVLTVPTMAAKIDAQKAGLGCGYLPLPSIREAVARGELTVKETDQGTRDTLLSVAWRQDARGKAMAWWIETLRNSATRAALVS